MIVIELRTTACLYIYIGALNFFSGPCFASQMIRVSIAMFRRYIRLLGLSYHLICIAW